MERDDIIRALGQTSGEIKAASQILGVTYRTLRRQIEKLEMQDLVTHIKRSFGRPLRGSPRLPGMAKRGPKTRAEWTAEDIDDIDKLFADVARLEDAAKQEQEIEKWLQSEDIPIECAAR